MSLLQRTRWFVHRDALSAQSAARCLGKSGVRHLAGLCQTPLDLVKDVSK